MSTLIKVLIADDHAMFAETLAGWLRTLPDMCVVDIVGRGDEAVKRAAEDRPDVALLDIDMPGLSCFEAARLIMQRLPKCAIIFVSAHTHDHYIEQVLAIKAAGYVSKSEPPEAVAAAIRAVAAGEAYFSAEIQARIVVDVEGARLAHAAHTPLSGLTQREREVLRLIARGQSKKEIADTLSVAVKTIEAHTDNLMKKLGIHDRVELTLFAIREGLAEA